MAIWLNVNIHSGIPIYIQIVEQVQHALDVGVLQPGDYLPPVRELASELTIAPNTIVKAYNELQHMGLIESRPGRGTIVTAQANALRHEKRVEALYERLHAVVHDAANMGIDGQEFLAAVQREIGSAFDKRRELT